MRKQILLLDQDNVLADWRGYFDSQIEERFGITPIVAKQFKMLDNYPPEHHDKVQQVLDLPDFYLNLEVIPGAVDAINYLNERFDVFICTSPYTTTLGSVSHKYEWVTKHLGPEWVNQVIITKDKTLVRGVALVDDKPTVDGRVLPSWMHVHFNQPYNEVLDTNFRIKDWSQESCDYLIEHFA